MNLGIPFGTLQLMVNAIMMIFVIRYDPSRIGLGTLANMTVVGYVAEFFMYVIDQFPVLETLSLTARIVIFVPALALFLLAASTYMCVDMGVAPYDAIPQIIAAKKGWSFRLVRTCWDFVMMVGGALLGATAGPVSVGITLFMVVLIGVVMCLPRIMEAVQSDEPPVVDDEKPVMLVTGVEEGLAEAIKATFEGVFADYEVRIEGEADVQSAILSGEADCAFVLEGLTSFTYYVEDLTLYDSNEMLASSALTERTGVLKRKVTLSFSSLYRFSSTT